MRQPAGGPAPLFVFDAGYDPVPLTEGLAATRAAILVRLRRDRCFYADPTSQPPTGRSRVASTTNPAVRKPASAGARPNWSRSSVGR